jgi:L-asparagine transporter-like permease
MPRWLALVTYALALVLLISIGFTPWVVLVFPAWVFLISVYILILNYRIQQGNEQQQDGLTVDE